MTTVPFFGDDVSVLWRDGAWRDFVPSLGGGDPLNSVLNALARFAVYLAFLVSLFRQDFTWALVIGLPSILVLFLAHQVLGDDSVPRSKTAALADNAYDDEDDDTQARRYPYVSRIRRRELFPTFSNPWANPSPADLGVGEIVTGPRDALDPRVRQATRIASTDGVVPDENDLWQKGVGDGLTHHTVAGAPYGDMDGSLRSWLAKEFQSTPSLKERHANYGPVDIDLRKVPAKPPYPYLPNP